MSPTAKIRLFEPDREAVLLERPNRFLVLAETAGRTVRAHCANPGRMRELMIPGTRVILEKPRGNPGRRTSFNLAAAYYDDLVIPLNSARANDAAGRLILPVLFPRSREVRREVPYRGSRVDYLLGSADSPMLLEVKACTLVEGGVALFPDAPTERGSRHLEELARFAGEGGRSAMLFVIMRPDAEIFMPNVHTDPVFSRRLIESAKDLSIHAASIRCGPDGLAEMTRPDVPVDLGRAAVHLEDRGCYLLVLELRSERIVSIGSLGETTFRPGSYVYVGSAARGLTARLMRHTSRRKTLFWHIDYLSRAADRVTAFPIRTARPLECRLARAFSALSDGSVPRFGCSDCSCGSHLFYLHEPALRNREFLRILHRFRHREALL